MAQGGGYFSRSWNLMTKDKGWIKPILVASVSLLVPIVGPLGVLGYVLEWARLTAWGYDAAPKQKNVDIGRCIAAGWRGFVAMLGWSIVWAIITSALLNLTHNNSVILFLLGILGLFVGTFFTVCAVRSSIYQSIGAGYRIDRIWEMIREDFGGFARVTGMILVMGLVIGLIFGLIIAALLMPFALSLTALMSDIAFSSSSVDSSFLYSELVPLLNQLTIPLILIVIAALIVSVVVDMIEYTAVALWIRQFDVPRWGASSDPLPPRVAPMPGLPNATYPAGAAPQPGAYPQQPAQPGAAPQPGGYAPQQGYPQQAAQPGAYVSQQPAPQQQVQSPAAQPQAAQSAAVPQDNPYVAQPAPVSDNPYVTQPAPQNGAQGVPYAQQPPSAPANQPGQSPAGPFSWQQTPAQSAPAGQTTQPAQAPAYQQPEATFVPQSQQAPVSTLDALGLGGTASPAPAPIQTPAPTPTQTFAPQAPAAPQPASAPQAPASAPQPEAARANAAPAGAPQDESVVIPLTSVPEEEQPADNSAAGEPGTEAQGETQH